MLGGGVIVLVAVLLWLVYLLPSLHHRRQYDAAERNAVRLNQALRVLAETSETPEEVRLELTARTAAAQQRLARQALAEREGAELEQAKVELEAARAARVAARNAPRARLARARRNTRIVLAAVIVGGVALAGYGGWLVVDTGSQLLLWTGIGIATIAGMLLRRMHVVTARSAITPAESDIERRPAIGVQDVSLEVDPRQWAPRELPRPLSSSAGSQASAQLDAQAARAELRRAAVEEAKRARAEAARPPSLAVARRERAEADRLGRSGPLDDAAIEAHVRRLLARRAAGE